jgi:hypothetical protein
MACHAALSRPAASNGDGNRFDAAYCRYARRGTRVVAQVDVLQVALGCARDGDVKERLRRRGERGAGSGGDGSIPDHTCRAVLTQANLVEIEVVIGIGSALTVDMYLHAGSRRRRQIYHQLHATEGVGLDTGTRCAGIGRDGDSQEGRVKHPDESD